jgi:hypothetical protein
VVSIILSLPHPQGYLSGVKGNAVRAQTNLNSACLIHGKSVLNLSERAIRKQGNAEIRELVREESNVPAVKSGPIHNTEFQFTKSHSIKCATGESNYGFEEILL